MICVQYSGARFAGLPWLEGRIPHSNVKLIFIDIRKSSLGALTYSSSSLQMTLASAGQSTDRSNKQKESERQGQRELPIGRRAGLPWVGPGEAGGSPLDGAQWHVKYCC